MKKMNIILLGLATMIIASSFIFFYQEAAAKRHAPLISYYTSFGGDMRGSHSETKIEKLNNDVAIVVSKNAEWHHQDHKVSEHQVSSAALVEIEKVYDEYKLYRYNKLPKSQFFAHDAGNHSYSFSFDDKSSLRFSDTQSIPTQGYEALKKIKAIIKTAVQKGEKLPGLVPPPNTETDGPSWKFIDDVCQLMVYEYSNNTLYFRIINGTKKDIPLKSPVQLYKLNADKRELLMEHVNKYNYLATAKYSEESYINLTIPRLTPGKYLLTLDKYEAPFEIK